MMRKNVTFIGMSRVEVKSAQQVTAAFLLPSLIFVDPSLACQASWRFMLIVALDLLQGIQFLKLFSCIYYAYLDRRS